MLKKPDGHDQDDRELYNFGVVMLLLVGAFLLSITFSSCTTLHIRECKSLCYQRNVKSFENDSLTCNCNLRNKSTEESRHDDAI